MVHVMTQAGDQREEDLKIIDVFLQVSVFVTIVDHQAHIHGVSEIVIRNAVVHLTQLFAELEYFLKLNGCRIWTFLE